VINQKRHYETRRVVMQCEHCGHKVMRAKRGPCPRCREGFLLHGEGQVRWLIVPAAIAIPGDD